MVPSVLRREFIAWSVGLGAAWVAGRGAQGEEVSWLPEVQRVPPNVPVLPRPLDAAAGGFGRATDHGAGSVAAAACGDPRGVARLPAAVCPESAGPAPPGYAE